MTVRFRNATFAGTHGAVQEVTPTGYSQRRYHWGLRGETEKRGGRGSRVLRLEIWFHNNYASYAALQLFLRNVLHPEINQHGTLQITDDNIGRTFSNCTLDSFEPIGDPLPDVAGTVDGVGKWFYRGFLIFWQADDT